MGHPCKSTMTQESRFDYKTKQQKQETCLQNSKTLVARGPSGPATSVSQRPLDRKVSTVQRLGMICYRPGLTTLGQNPATQPGGGAGDGSVTSTQE